MRRTPGAVILVGHNPGLHQLAVELLVEGAASASEMARVRSRFPTATAAVFEMDAAGRPTFDGLYLAAPTSAAGSWSKSLHDVAAGALRVFDPETAHGLTIKALKTGLGPRATGLDDPILAVEIAGLTLPNCLGLAAGFDKNAEVSAAMLAAGFGFVECGTVTPSLRRARRGRACSGSRKTAR